MKPLTTLAGCLMLFISHAQQIMPRLGLSMSTIKNEPQYGVYNASCEPGVMTGVTSQIDFGGNLGLNVDLLFTQKGWSYETEGTGFAGTSDISIYYGELICMPFYKWRNVFFMAGPGLSYGLFGSAYEEFTFSNGDQFANDWPIRFTEIDDPRFAETYMDRRLTLNWQVSVGVELWKTVLVDLRYQEAMMDIPFLVKPSQRPSRAPANWFQSVQVGAAVRLSRG